MNLHDISPPITGLWWSHTPHECLNTYEASATDHHACADAALHPRHGTYFCECVDNGCDPYGRHQPVHYFDCDRSDGRPYCPYCLNGAHPVPPTDPVSPSADS